MCCGELAHAGEKVIDHEELFVGVGVQTACGCVDQGWTVQWPASGNRGPTSFDGVVDGDTSQFQSAHGSFHATALSTGELEITGELNDG